MELKEAIEHLKMEDAQYEEYQGHDEAFALVLSAAEKAEECAEKAEKWDAIEWLFQMGIGEAFGRFFDSDYHKLYNTRVLADRTYLHIDALVSAYRKAKEGKK